MRAMIRWIADLMAGLEVLSYFLPVVLGIGCIAYVTFTWVIHWVNNGQYLAAATSTLGVLTVSAFAALRIPIALWLFFGTAALLGTVFLMGSGHVVLP